MRLVAAVGCLFCLMVATEAQTLAGANLCGFTKSLAQYESRVQSIQRFPLNLLPGTGLTGPGALPRVYANMTWGPSSVDIHFRGTNATWHVGCRFHCAYSIVKGVGSLETYVYKTEHLFSEPTPDTFTCYKESEMAQGSPNQNYEVLMPDLCGSKIFTGYTGNPTTDKYFTIKTDLVKVKPGKQPPTTWFRTMEFQVGGNHSSCLRLPNDTAPTYDNDDDNIVWSDDDVLRPNGIGWLSCPFEEGSTVQCSLLSLYFEMRPLSPKFGMVDSFYMRAGFWVVVLIGVVFSFGWCFLFYSAIPPKVEEEEEEDTDSESDHSDSESESEPETEAGDSKADDSDYDDVDGSDSGSGAASGTQSTEDGYRCPSCHCADAEPGGFCPMCGKQCPPR